MEKKCNGCNNIKDVSLFHKDRRSKDGLRNHCKICINEINRLYRCNNIEKYNEARKTYYRKNIIKKRKERIL